MTLPLNPDVETVLRSCAETLQNVLLPELDSDWARYSGHLCVASLEYAIGLLGDDRNAARADELRAAIDSLRTEIESASDASEGSAAMKLALLADSPFVAASQLLVAGQNEPGALANRVRETLHPLLHRQLDDEMAASMPMFIAFAKNMGGHS